ncbi:hypothetical protein PCLA_04f0664 [Pseudomonas citronellolis]|nr:hypothetical protein PCLA_04f0664 [Pseudomonas citronellolis]
MRRVGSGGNDIGPTDLANYSVVFCRSELAREQRFLGCRCLGLTPLPHPSPLPEGEGAVWSELEVRHSPGSPISQLQPQDHAEPTTCRGQPPLPSGRGRRLEQAGSSAFSWQSHQPVAATGSRRTHNLQRTAPSPFRERVGERGRSSAGLRNNRETLFASKLAPTTPPPLPKMPCRK